MSHFVTITKPINNKNHGVFEYLKYLTSEKKHPQDEIINFKDFNRKIFMNNSIESEKKLIELRKKQKKANKAKNYSQSFVFSLPSQDREISKNEWNLIVKDMILELYDLYETKDFEFIKKNVFINIHNRKNKNSHMNLILNKIVDNGIKDFSKKRFYYKLRTSFTRSVEKNLKIKAPLTEFEKKKKLANDMYKRQSKIIEKQQKTIDYIKWTTIFLQNAFEAHLHQEKGKIQKNLEKVKKNIEIMKKINGFDKNIIESFEKQYQTLNY